MDNHYFNEQGEYIGSAPVQGDQLPPLNAIRVAPLQREGFWPVLNTARDGWELVEDHRGLAGWIDGQSATISVLGPLPAGWSDTAPVPEDRRTPEEKRRAAYCAKADPVRDEFLGYEQEAEEWRARGDEDKAATAKAKAGELRGRWLDIKERIRAEYPDDGEARYRLSSSGVYHALSCSRATSGDSLTLGEIAARKTDARPCAFCQPPAVTGGGNG